MTEKLYAWADRTKIGIGDHTWVSSYSPANRYRDRILCREISNSKRMGQYKKLLQSNSKQQNKEN